jgi:Sulfotransferase family
MCNPLVIGGTGGSGTRVVARIVRLGGRYMGDERNGCEDAMPLARFEWEWGLRWLELGSSPRMTEAFERAIAEHLAELDDGAPWGWKHPHSYLFLPFLRERFPRMRFIHVVRDGRDIALSTNQQQARRYGSLLGRAGEPESVTSAAWWAWANERARADGESLLGAAYTMIRLEDLCADPLASTRRIVEFSEHGNAALSAEVATPESLGRWRDHDRAAIGEIEAACGGALLSFGYPLAK